MEAVDFCAVYQPVYYNPAQVPGDVANAIDANNAIYQEYCLGRTL